MTAGFNLYRALAQDGALVAGFADNGLRMPVLAIGGRHSVGGRLAETLGRHADNPSSLVVEDCGHFVAEEASDEFCDALVRFLTA